jgi:hypothetical protein
LHGPAPVAEVITAESGGGPGKKSGDFDRNFVAKCTLASESVRFFSGVARLLFQIPNLEHRGAKNS